MNETVERQAGKISEELPSSVQEKNQRREQVKGQMGGAESFYYQTMPFNQ